MGGLVDGFATIFKPFAYIILIGALVSIVYELISRRLQANKRNREIQSNPDRSNTTHLDDERKEKIGEAQNVLEEKSQQKHAEKIQKGIEKNEWVLEDKMRRFGMRKGYRLGTSEEEELQQQRKQTQTQEQTTTSSSPKPESQSQPQKSAPQSKSQQQTSQPQSQTQPQSQSQTLPQQPQQPQRRQPLTEAELLRMHQDQEYEQSIREDKRREKEKNDKEEKARLKAQQEQEEKEWEEQERKIIEEQLIAMIPTEPSANDSNAIAIAIKLPDGRRLTRRFLPDNTLKSVSAFVRVSEPSLLTSTQFRFRQATGPAIEPNNTTIADAGLTNRVMLLLDFSQ